jgi:hypothetical protein
MCIGNFYCGKICCELEEDNCTNFDTRLGAPIFLFPDKYLYSIRRTSVWFDVYKIKKKVPDSHNISARPHQSGWSSKKQLPKKRFTTSRLRARNCSRSSNPEFSVFFSLKDMGNVLYRDSDKVRSNLPSGYCCESNTISG